MESCWRLRQIKMPGKKEKEKGRYGKKIWFKRLDGDRQRNYRCLRRLDTVYDVDTPGMGFSAGCCLCCGAGADCNWSNLVSAHQTMGKAVTVKPKQLLIRCYTAQRNQRQKERNLK